ncbi:MAG: hypothetical protein M1814_001792 [Vezdaea aestivalis]|nr:MAG: hypothetical protein M1814_001792 [Vezdaea aestivalis]
MSNPKTNNPSPPSTTSQSHHSLPPRPPPSIGPSPAILQAQSVASSFPSFRPRQLGPLAQNWTSHSPTVSAPPAPPRGFSAQQSSIYPSTGYSQPQYQSTPTPTSYYPQTPSDFSQPATPQIQNPFPLPGQDYGGGANGKGENFDPELEAQIAQWQSAYASKDDSNSKTGNRGQTRFGGATAEGSASASGANAGPVGGRGDNTTADVDSIQASTGADAKQKTVMRSGGGQTWNDSSLLEWDPAHFRLFVGNLAGEVTDESLLKAFSKYPSLQRARVIRDKQAVKGKDDRAFKSKGYGFVSFSDGDEYFQAARNMQGKYIGSHPILLRRSTTEIRPVKSGDRKGKHGKKGGGSHGSGDKTGAGIHKKANKTKGGLRIIG